VPVQGCILPFLLHILCCEVLYFNGLKCRRFIEDRPTSLEWAV
jgi:hypothetical protein